MRVPSSVQSHFAQVPAAHINRSNFVRSHTYKTTFNEGWLVPFYADEVLPGDTFKLRATMFARLLTLLTPYMDNLYLSTFYFFVPNRLLWNNWQKFMGEQDNPGDSTSYLVPTVTAPAGGFVPPANWSTPTNAELSGALYDYLGVPTKVAGLVVDQLHARAYNFIWNQCFRDENMQNSVVVDKGDGPDTYTNYKLLKRGKRHDYFTSCLPFTQKGTAVSLPLGTTAPILGLYTNTANTAAITGVTPIYGTPAGAGSISNSTGVLWASSKSPAGTAPATAFNSTNANVYADLSSATAATINQLRQAATLQQFYERDARGGTRYIEIILSHFNVVSPDARLQRPEYLGGSTTLVDVQAVPQTSSATGQPTPQANLAAYGTATLHGNQNGFVKSFVEHGVILGLMCVHADITYQQGLNKMFSRQTRVDFYWPTFAHLGEQAVNNLEIYAQGTAADAQVFGYQERYAEYRYKPSLLTGLMRSNATGTLDSWHLAPNFTSLPSLGDTFISENPPVGRVVAVTTQNHFLLDSHIDLNCVRPMPIYSVPGLMRF